MESLALMDWLNIDAGADPLVEDLLVYVKHLELQAKFYQPLVCLIKRRHGQPLHGSRQILADFK